MLNLDIPPELAQTALEQSEELSYVDASKVYAVIQSTLERLALIGVINVDVQEQALMLTQTVGEEIASMIRVQKSLEAEFQRLIELQHTMRHEPNEIKKEENDASIKLVAEKLRASIEALCNKLKDNPNVAENMAKVASERQSLQALLSQSLEQLQTMRKIPCITEMVMAEMFRRREIKEVVEREKTAARAVATLRMELKDEKEDHDKTMQACRAQVAALKDEIRNQKKVTYIEAIHTSRELQCKGGHKEQLYSQEILELEAELQALEKMHLLEQHVHQSSLEQLHKVQSGLAGQAAKWAHEMQAQSREQEQLLQELSAQHKTMMAAFREVEKEHAKEIALKSERDAAFKTFSEAEAAKQELNKVQTSGAIVIQAFWRGYKARQAQKAGKDKGKKGKKKK